MPGLFQGLEIGKRALLTHQLSLQTIGHNIANVNTPGYTRQRVRITNSMPEQTARHIVGTGIEADDIRHVRDLFLGRQWREANKSLGDWTYQQKTLSQIETLLNEPSENGLGATLDAFWDSWSELSTNSDSVNNRRLILTQANQLIASFRQLAEHLTELREATDSDIRNMVSEVNRLTGEIAQINDHIAEAELGGENANDLRDTRDRLTDELANLIDVRVIEKPNGASVVTMGAMVLVDASDAYEISTEVSNQAGQITNTIVWKGTDVKLWNISGQLAGLVKSRDELIPNALAELDTLAAGMVDNVNALHVTGYGVNGSTGVHFFNPAYRTAATIRLNDELNADINKVAASETAGNDNRLALAIAGLRGQAVMNRNTMTINEFHASLVGDAGVKAREAIAFAGNYELLLHQIDNARQSVEGVSLDEEMSNLVKFQHAYDAAARVITTMDQALDTVISGMGIVGRV